VFGLIIKTFGSCIKTFEAGSGWILVFGLIIKTLEAASKLLKLDQVGF
jgi:hypothetical protein